MSPLQAFVCEAYYHVMVDQMHHEKTDDDDARTLNIIHFILTCFYTIPVSLQTGLGMALQKSDQWIYQKLLT